MLSNWLDTLLPKALVVFILGFPAVIRATLGAIEGAPTPEWLGSATQISAFGLVAWIVYYVLSTWIPKMQDQSAQQLAAQRDAHRDAMNELAKAHSQAVDKIATSFQDSIKTQRLDLLALKGVCPNGKRPEGE